MRTVKPSLFKSRLKKLHFLIANITVFWQQLKYTLQSSIMGLSKSILKTHFWISYKCTIFLRKNISPVPFFINREPEINKTVLNWMYLAKEKLLCKYLKTPYSAATKKCCSPLSEINISLLHLSSNKLQKEKLKEYKRQLIFLNHCFQVN